MATEKRLIDANALDGVLKDFESRYQKAHFALSAKAISNARQIVYAMKTVDAVEVVRCRDCLSFEETYRTVGKVTGKVYCGGCCYHWDYEQGMSPNQVDGNDFCSYGERKDNDL